MNTSVRLQRLFSPKTFKATFLVLSLFIGACVGQPKQYISKLDPLAIQQMQTDEFETSKKILFASTLATFQDMGFNIAAADADTGLITARSATQSKYDWIWSGKTTGVTVTATAFIEELRAGHATARINLVESTSASNFYGGGGTHDIPIEKAETYEKLFAKIREAVFVRSAHQGTK